MDFDHIVWKSGIISHFEKLSACFLLDTAAGYFDIKQFYNIQSAYDCQLACQNEPQCKLIVYDAPITFCYLKTGVRTPTYYQSGMILSSAFCEGNVLLVKLLMSIKKLCSFRSLMVTEVTRPSSYPLIQQLKKSQSLNGLTLILVDIKPKIKQIHIVYQVFHYFL